MAHVQVVLRQDLSNLGVSGDIVRVRAGFARNYLIPRGLAVVATRGNVKQIEHEKTVARHRLELRRNEAQKAAAELEKLTVAIPKQASPEGKLFGSVTSQEVAQILKERHEIDVDRRKLVMPEEQIKEVGTYEVTIKLDAGVEAKFKIDVKTAA